MSCQRTVKFFETVAVKIDVCNKEELEKLEKCIIFSINQKLEKLNIIIKNCDVYSNGNCILVHDRFNICPFLKEVADAFGLSCDMVDCSLKGKTYLISDDLLRVLKQIGVEYNYGLDIANQDLNDEIKNIIGDFGTTRVNQAILNMVMNIKKNGVYSISKTRAVNQVYDDNGLIDHSEGKWSVDENKLKERLLKMSKEAEDTIKKTNAYLRDGTAKLIYARTKQMGYSVQQIKKETQVQLVLVRCE